MTSITTFFLEQTFEFQSPRGHKAWYNLVIEIESYFSIYLTVPDPFFCKFAEILHKNFLSLKPSWNKSILDPKEDGIWKGRFCHQFYVSWFWALFEVINMSFLVPLNLSASFLWISASSIRYFRSYKHSGNIFENTLHFLFAYHLLVLC